MGGEGGEGGEDGCVDRQSCPQSIAGFQCHAIQNRSKSKSKPFNR